MSSETKYCKDCGSEIARKAEICPECGVRQESVGLGGSGDEEIDGGEYWRKVKGAFGIGIASTFLGWMLVSAGLGGGSAGTAGLGMLIALVGVILWLAWAYFIYKDASYVQQQAQWSPSPGLFGFGSLFIAFIGWYYMFKRYSVTKE